MKNLLLCILLFSFSGCSLNPKVNPKIDNQQGTIDELKNITNGMNAEIGKMKQDAEIKNSQLKEVQQGLLNMNAAFSRNENSGIQILQGDGGLIFIFSIIVVAMLLIYHFRLRALNSEKSLEIMSSELKQHDDIELKANILRAAMYTGCEKKIYTKLFKK